MSEDANDTSTSEDVADSDNPKAMPSCLSNGNTSTNSGVIKHRVTFPEDDKDLVTAYLEPDSPWDSTPVTPEDLISLYQDSCVKHSTPPIEQVIDQLKTCYQPCPSLEVVGPVDLAALEALEAVLRRVRFQTLRVKCDELSDDAAVALFDMLEYYESAVTLCLSCDRGLGLRSWQACSRMMKKAHGMSELDVRCTPVTEQVMPVLCRALKVGCKLTSLQLGRCGVSDRALIMLVGALRLNNTLQELTLADNNLTCADASHLGSMLRDNSALRYLDISNNAIEDVGCAVICEALMEQCGEGLQALVLWNTCLTSSSGHHLGAVLHSTSPLETLNVGQNQIGSAGIVAMKTAMEENKYLKQFGVQNANLTCDGAEVLAEVLRTNETLQRVDIRGNKFGARGLAAIQTAMQNGATIQRIDLDDAPGACQEVIEDIRGLCRLNEAHAIVAVEESCRVSNLSRKISLTCETLITRSNVADDRGLLAEPRRTGRLRSPAPSPIPSPSSSPIPSPSRNRFRVSRVSDDGSPVLPISPVSPVASRFRVTVVEPEPILADDAHVKVGFSVAPTADKTASFTEKTEPMEVEGAQAVPEPVTSTADNTQMADNHSSLISGRPRVRKQPSGIEKLLGLFQNPGSLFSSVASVTLSSEKDKNTQAQDSGGWDWGTDK